MSQSRTDVSIGSHTVAIGASIGVAVIPRCSTVPEELLAMADREMYAVKRSGGGGVKLVSCAPVREPPPPSNLQPHKKTPHPSMRRSSSGSLPA